MFLGLSFAFSSPCSALSSGSRAFHRYGLGLSIFITSSSATLPPLPLGFFLYLLVASCQPPAASMKILSAIWLVSLATRPVLGALVGYGIYPYNPPCAFACHRSLSTLMLQCSGDMTSSGHMGGHSAMISPQCRAGDSSWLTTLAWCLRTKCAEYQVSISELEAFWETQSTGDQFVAPEWSYSTTLFNIAQAPTQELTRIDDTLNSTALVNPSVYEAQYNALTAVQRENVVESGYGSETRPCTEGKTGKVADL